MAPRSKNCTRSFRGALLLRDQSKRGAPGGAIDREVGARASVCRSWEAERALLPASPRPLSEDGHRDDEGTSPYSRVDPAVREGLPEKLRCCGARECGQGITTRDEEAEPAGSRPAPRDGVRAGRWAPTQPAPARRAASAGGASGLKRPPTARPSLRVGTLAPSRAAGNDCLNCWWSRRL